MAVLYQLPGADPGIEKRGFVPLTCMVPPMRARAVRGLCTRPSIKLITYRDLDSVTVIGFKGQRKRRRDRRRPGLTFRGYT